MSTKSRFQSFSGRFFVAFIIVFFATLSVLGLSGSSLRVLSATNTAESHETRIGQVRPIRSDEYLVWSPIKLGQANAGFPNERVFGLGALDVGRSWRHQLPYPNLGQVVFSPVNLPLFIPWRSIGFAAFWWLPYGAAILGVFAWLRNLGVRSFFAAGGALLAVIAPASFWWSGWNLVSIAHASLGCAAVVRLCTGGSKKFKRGLLILSAVWAFAGLPWYYQPWAISAAICFGVPTAAVILSRYRSIRRHPPTSTDEKLPVRELSTVALLTVSSWVLFLWHERHYFEALARTEYPGQRRLVGGGLSIGHVFSALFSSDLAGSVGESLRNSNLSEFSMGWSILIPFAIGVLMVNRIQRQSEGSSLALSPNLIMCGSYIGIFWAFVSVPLKMAKLTPLSLVQPVRLAPFIGTMAACGLAAALSDRESIKTPHRWSIQQFAGTAAPIIFVVGWSSSDIRLNFAPISWSSIGIIVLLALVIIVLIGLNRSRVAISLMAVGAVWSIIGINPLVRDLGSLNASPIVDVVRKESRTVPTAIWAVDDLYLVPVINFQGINSLSSFNDPVDMHAWRLIDPKQQESFNWNRFAYILFDWQPENFTPQVTSPAPDVISILISPCSKRMSLLRLTHIVSSKPLDQGCLSLAGEYKWMGNVRYIYRTSFHA